MSDKFKLGKLIILDGSKCDGKTSTLKKKLDEMGVGKTLVISGIGVESNFVKAANNIKNLELAWSFDMNSTRALEATPIVDNGIMFLTSEWSIVYAINAETGEEIWSYDPLVPKSWGRKACCDVVNRGVAVWKGNVFFASLDGRLIKLDARAGKLIWEIKGL